MRPVARIRATSSRRSPADINRGLRELAIATCLGRLRLARRKAPKASGLAVAESFEAPRAEVLGEALDRADELPVVLRPLLPADEQGGARLPEIRLPIAGFV